MAQLIIELGLKTTVVYVELAPLPPPPPPPPPPNIENVFHELEKSKLKVQAFWTFQTIPHI